MLCQAVNELWCICVWNIFNQALIAFKILIYIAAEIAWLTLSQILRAVYTKLPELI